MKVDLTAYHEIAGVCDRLRAVTLAIAISKHHGEREILVRHKPVDGCPYRLSDIFKVDGFDLVETEDPIDTDALSLDSFRSFPSAEKASEAFAELPELETLRIWKAAFTTLCPADAIADKLDTINISRRCIGVHLRFTDKRSKKPSVYEIRESDFTKTTRLTVKATLSQLKRHDMNQVFLACDDIEAREDCINALEKHGVEVLLNKDCTFEPESFRQTSGQDFAVDMFGLSRCPVIVGSVNSGVPVTAALIQGLPIESILWGRYYKRFRSLDKNLAFIQKRRERYAQAPLPKREHCPSLYFLGI